MNTANSLRTIVIVFALCAVALLCLHYLSFFGNIAFLGGLVFLEIMVACLWNYDQSFFILLVISFCWAGMRLPLESAFILGRWGVLGAGAGVGFVIWMKVPRRQFGTIHLLAFFCICAAFASASVSLFVQMAMLKAFSLLLLFMYCSTGARLAVLHREEQFFRGLLWGAEIAVYFTALVSLGLGIALWGNPNSLGAVMSVAVFPFLFWGWRISEGGFVRLRRLVGLLLCTYLVIGSLARAGMIAIAAVTLVYCFCLREHKLLVKIFALVLVAVAVTGVVSPETLNRQLDNFKEAMIYKGHKDEGLMGSRRQPWEQTVDTIKTHPLFGTGYGTSPTGEDPGLNFGTFNSSSETAREHGSSYMTILEWVGLLGVVPFVLIIGNTARNFLKICFWMRRQREERHYAVPMAMLMLAGLIHAGFEDWMFAVGYYLCVFFWFFAFVLADYIPDESVEPLVCAAPRILRPVPAGYGIATPYR
jgi:O-antigen ligase